MSDTIREDARSGPGYDDTDSPMDESDHEYHEHISEYMAPETRGRLDSLGSDILPPPSVHESEYSICPTTTTLLINHIVVLGDSLSDRGVANSRMLCGCMSMGTLSGLGISPHGRYTNGYTWCDHLITAMVQQDIIRKLMRKDATPTDISDAVVNGDVLVRSYDRLNKGNALHVSYGGRMIFRTYNEGGLTSKSFRWNPSVNIALTVVRMIVSYLGVTRQRLFYYDRKLRVDRPQKERTLIIEWSGTNDLITVNSTPNIAAAHGAVLARIANIDSLRMNGYKNFVLLNVPDIALTPRYQLKTQQERDAATRVVKYFNDTLQDQVEHLSDFYPDINIDYFDINVKFRDIFENPEKYAFDRKLRTTPFISSNDFEILPNGTSPATGYMFWDDVHPTADMHAVLASFFYQTYCTKKIRFKLPEEHKVKRAQSCPSGMNFT